MVRYSVEILMDLLHKRENYEQRQHSKEHIAYTRQHEKVIKNSKDRSTELIIELIKREKE